MTRQSSWARGIGLTIVSLAFSWVSPNATAQVSMEWVLIDNVGNAADPTTGFGAVGYEYRIGKFEVTNAQYAAFLNAVATSDPNGLYVTAMGTSARGGITRSGSAGSFTYSVRESMGDKPVNFVDWYDVARMANWITNGQGSGGTESGVYTFTGINTISAITRDLSNPKQVFIPTEDEWYKAAYHQPLVLGGDADDYWLYATQSNAAPMVANATSTGDVANPGPWVVNYDDEADWDGQDGHVTTVGSAGSTSYYGALDMNGNVWEWNETQIGSSRVLRGGSYGVQLSNLRSSFQLSTSPINWNVAHGFRLASPVPPNHCNPADLNDAAAPSPASATFGIPDGALTPTDFSAFVFYFGTGNLAADINDAAAPSPAFPSFGVPDGLLTPTDFSAFAAYFGAGCPCVLPGCP